MELERKYFIILKLMSVRSELLIVPEIPTRTGFQFTPNAKLPKQNYYAFSFSGVKPEHNKNDIISQVQQQADTLPKPMAKRDRRIFSHNRITALNSTRLMRTTQD